MKQLWLWVTLFCSIATSVPAATIFATPGGGPGYDATGKLVATTTKMLSGEVKPNLSPGDILQLLADSPEPARTTNYHFRLLLISLGTANSAPITIRGLDSKTRVVGKSLRQLGRCDPPPNSEINTSHCADSAHSWFASNLPSDLLDASLAMAPDTSAGAVSQSDKVVQFAMPAFGGSNILAQGVCFDISNVDGVLVENLWLDGCFISAVRATKSRRVTLRHLLIVGGTYGLAIRGNPSDPNDLTTLEDVTWIQDTSGYEPIVGDGKIICRAALAKYACAGDMWRKVPWGSSHHGTFEQHNGALLGGTDMGRVIFRRNKIYSAYNGIRLKAKACDGMPSYQIEANCRSNPESWIYDNVFSYVRDNPIELEVFARNAHIFGNIIHNSHAWFSFDGMGGGPIYIYGNRGWFDDMPITDWAGTIPDDQECKRVASVHPSGAPLGALYDPAFDRKFDFEYGRWLAVGLESVGTWMVPDQQRCEQSLTGRVIKLSLPPAKPEGPFYYPSQPIYIFNNSWFLRAPILAGSSASGIRHWNNAIAFCEVGTAGYHNTLCDFEAAPTGAQDCGDEYLVNDDLAAYPSEKGEIPFFDCFRWLPYDENGKELASLWGRFDYDVSTNGFPKGLTAAYPFERRGRIADPGFANAATGDFTLVEGAVAAQSDCRIQFNASGDLECGNAGSTSSFAGAMAPDGSLYRGPAGPKFEPPD